MGATSPTRAISSARPSSASRSSVAGWVVAARGSACSVSFTSNSRTGRPRRPSSHVHNKPTGPPPAINTRRSSKPISENCCLLISTTPVIPTTIRYNSSDIEGSKKERGEDAPEAFNPSPKFAILLGRSLADNRQNLDLVLETHLTTEDRILDQGRNLCRGANASDGAE